MPLGASAGTQTLLPRQAVLAVPQFYGGWVGYGGRNASHTLAPEPSLMQEIGLCHSAGGIVAFVGEAKGSRATPETWQLPKAGAACIAMEGGECALKRESLSQPQPTLEHFLCLLKKSRPSPVCLSFEL